MPDQEWRKAHQKWILLAILAIAAVIMFADLPAKSFWLDETFTANLTPQVQGLVSPGELAHICLSQLERRPLLYFFSIYYWALFAGNSEVALRLPSVIFALLSICLVARLAKSLGLAQLAPAAAALLALSPTFVMYSRMARAYSMPVCVGLLSMILYLELVKHPSRRLWLGYTVATALLLYTDYVLWLLLLGQNIDALYHIVKGRTLSLRLWFLSQAIPLLLFVPGFVVLLQQPGRIGGQADLSGGILGVGVRMVYQVYSALVGETIYPWRPIAIAGLACAAIVAALGVVALMKYGRARVVVFFLGLLVVLCNVLFVVLAPGWSFIYVPSHTLFILPFVVLVLAAGLASIRPRTWRALASTLLILLWGVGQYNYFTNRDFHNPVYIMPSREATRQILSESEPGDVILTEVDSVVDYYFDRIPARPLDVWSLEVNYEPDMMQARSLVYGQQSPRIWLVTIGRDDTRAAAVTDQFSDLLKTDFKLEMSRGYVEQDATYHAIKQQLLKRPDYEYKLLVQLYVRK